MEDSGYKVTLKDVHTELKELRGVIETRLDKAENKSNKALILASTSITLLVAVIAIILKSKF